MHPLKVYFPVKRDIFLCAFFALVEMTVCHLLVLIEFIEWL